ncbi:MAG: B12-binding domain-containing radical SAM protein [Desulfobacterota bacterium]|nr:B12-binding domain-containing radical SAM protein [Thermodesulfobacteriota bacterium]
MKILLLQLPLQGHDFFFSGENIPLATAGLCLLAREAGFEAELLAEPYMSYGNDRSILHTLFDFKPDVVAMSCYLWNIERSLFLAREIKRSLPSCIVVLGGPEITPENPFLRSCPDFDIGVVGEGEWVWKALLDSSFEAKTIPGLILPGGDKRGLFTGYSPSPVDLNRLSSPFLGGVLDSHLKKVLWVESVRGCVHRCAYCYYHKRFSGVRPFPLDRLREEIGRARERGMEEIVFLDPCWNRHPRRGELLQRLLVINPDRRLKLYAECEAEEIDPQTARTMARAGFVELEVGLQSIHQGTLRRIHRRLDLHRFLERVRSLQEAGIELMVDLIAGLPGETLQDILNSLYWVLDHEAYDSLMLYPLSLIPSTELYRRSQSLGLKAMAQPPYLVTRTPHLQAEEIHQAFLEYEKEMGEEVAPLEMPPGLDEGGKDLSFLKGLSHLVDWTSLEKMAAFPSLEDRLAYSLTIRMGQEVIERPEHWSQLLRNYLERNPFSLLSVEVPKEASPEQLLPLWELASNHSHPIERDYTVPHSPYRSLLTFSRWEGVIWKWPDPREWKPLGLFDGQKVFFQPTLVVKSSSRETPRWFQRWIAERYPDPPAVKPWDVPRD